MIYYLGINQNLLRKKFLRTKTSSKANSKPIDRLKILYNISYIYTYSIFYLLNKFHCLQKLS